MNSEQQASDSRWRRSWLCLTDVLYCVSVAAPRRCPWARGGACVPTLSRAGPGLLLGLPTGQQSGSSLCPWVDQRNYFELTWGHVMLWTWPHVRLTPWGLESGQGLPSSKLTHREHHRPAMPNPGAAMAVKGHPGPLGPRDWFCSSFLNSQRPTCIEARPDPSHLFFHRPVLGGQG